MKSADVTVALPAQPAQVGQPAPRTAPAPDPVTPGGADFSEVAARTVGAVTNISALQVVNVPNSPFANDPFFRQFFDDRDLFGFSERRRAERRLRRASSRATATCSPTTTSSASTCAR